LILNVIFNTLKHKDSSIFHVIKKLFSYVSYYYNLNRGIYSNKIYHNIENQNKEYIDFIQSLKKEDFELFDRLFSKDIKKFLSKTRLLEKLEFDKKIGLSQVGYNTIFIDEPNFGLWTTGRATFYIPTKKEKINKIVIELFAVPPLKVTIGLENLDLQTIEMKKLSKKKIEILVESPIVTDTISELFVNTDVLWYPEILRSSTKTVTVGICIKSIHVYYS